MSTYGDNREQFANNVLVGTDKWILLASVTKSSIVRIRNMSTINEASYSWDKDAPIGAQMCKGEVDILDDVKGLLYGRAMTGSVIMNVFVLPMYREY